PACGWDGHFCLLGYTTRPNYDPSIHTVRVPIFQNATYWKGLEFDLTKAVIREIETKTPFKVVTCGPADTELQGKIINFNKMNLTFNQNNEVREVQTTLGVELVGRDPRPGHTGDILSQQPPTKPGEPTPTPAPEIKVTPVLVQSEATFIPEVCPSITTSKQRNIDRLAVQNVSRMEKW